jgi:hypothetical protein
MSNYICSYIRQYIALSAVCNAPAPQSPAHNHPCPAAHQLIDTTYLHTFTSPRAGLILKHPAYVHVLEFEIYLAHGESQAGNPQRPERCAHSYSITMRPDPRIRQNLDRLSTQLESAADTARTGCFTFTKSYIEPCFSSLADCCTSCLPHAKSAHRHHHHHHRHRNARRNEFPFAFYDYDDYDSDEDDGPSRGFLAWGTDELDRLLAGSGSAQPSTRNERMFYGAVGDPASAGIRRKGTMPGRDSPDPTLIPGTSMFGFLSTFGFRGKGMRYKPSAANLQEHPQRGGGALDVAFAGTGKGRQRSGTGSSGGSQGDSLRSRGDLWPSEDEDDAVVIGDDAFPRGSDGESNAEVVGLGIGSEEDLRHEDLLVEDAEDDRRRMMEYQKRLAMQRGPSSGSMVRQLSPPPRGSPN